MVLGVPILKHFRIKSQVIHPLIISKLLWQNDIKVATVFLSYKMELFPFQNNPKNLDRSYKMESVFGTV